MWERCGQGGLNSGRYVSTCNIGTVGACSMTSPSTSSVVGSAQCRSSHATSTGCRSASAASHATSASSVCCFCCCGVNVSAA